MAYRKSARPARARASSRGGARSARRSAGRARPARAGSRSLSGGRVNTVRIEIVQPGPQPVNRPFVVAAGAPGKARF